MKALKTVLFILFHCCFVISLFAQNHTTLRNTIDDLVYNQLNINFDRSPGFIIGVIKKDSTFILPYGTIIKDTSVFPHPKNLFEIGNLSNIFTARLVNILVEKTIIDKEASINNYLPDSLQNPTAANITIQQLLTHTSGLTRVPLGIGATQKEDNQPYKFYTKKMLGEYLKEYVFLNSDVNKYNYSPLGYAIIELIIEHISTLSFEEVLHNNLLNNKFPNIGITLLEDQKKLLVQGFDKAHQTTAPWEYSSFQSAVGLKSNLIDMLTLLRENIDGSTYDGMQIAAVPTGMEKNIFAGEAWHIIQPKRYYPIIAHTGSTSGYRGYMAFVKETRTGVVVLSNSEYALRGLGYFILKKLNRNFKRK